MSPLADPPPRLAGYIPDLSTPFDEHGVTDLATFAKLL
jgi:hypothetical protein